MEDESASTAVTERVAAPFVVVVVGPPASGKSTIGRLIAARWGLPVVSKDDVKEVLFDTIGLGDVAWSMKLGRAAFALLDTIIALQMKSGQPFLVDAAFTPEFENEKFRRWRREHGFTVVQVVCSAAPDERARRFRSRAADGSRHPGHADDERAHEFAVPANSERYAALDVPGPVIRYASDSDSVDALMTKLDQVFPAS